MIPNFKKSGLLPEGVHLANWEAFKARFVINSYRDTLLRGMEEGLKLLYEFGCKEVYVGGSYVTDNPEPGDVDVLYDNTNMHWKVFLREHPEFGTKPYLVRQRKKKYNTDFLAVNAFEDYLVQFFQFDRDGNSKGIIKLNLAEIFEHDKERKAITNHKKKTGGD